MEPLDNPVQRYAWGSRIALANLLGQPSPSTEPQAELWMGAHPSAPSRLARSAQSLPERIAQSPLESLGPQSVERFGTRLPFLLKVLAAETPLSLQAHPSASQAEAGFAEEERRGVPLSAPQRNYKDRFHKPELICALTPFEALCGFRPLEQTLQLFSWLKTEALLPYLQSLSQAPDERGLKAVFAGLMTLNPAAQKQLVQEVVAAAEARTAAGETAAQARQLVARLASLYPGDVGVVSALMLNQVRLEPGEALYLPAGNLHAYLQGVGVEIMASSDNVLRGGLTPKHVDVPELLRVLDFRSGPVPVLRPRRLGSEEVYQTPAAEFRLSRLVTAGEGLEELRTWGPEILFCSQGTLRLHWDQKECAISQGQSVFVPATVGSYRVLGEGTLYRAAVNG